MTYDIPFLETLMMRLRGVPVGRIRTELRKAERHSLAIDHVMLQAHFFAGGDLDDLTDALVFAQHNGMKLNAQTASAAQLISHYQEAESFTEKLRRWHAEGIRDADEYLAKGPPPAE